MILLSHANLDISPNFFNAARHTDVNCRLHLHYSMEVVCVFSGELIMNVNGIDRRICEGQATFMLPFEQHSFLTPEKSECLVIVFSPDITADFYERVKNKLLVTEVFTSDSHALKVCNSILARDNLTDVDIKAVLYPLLSDIIYKCEFASGGRAPDKTFIEAVKYIQQNYTLSQISLTSVAKSLGVHSVYLSRIFTQNANMSFSSYVNLIRCNYVAEQLCRDNESTLSEIALNSGFGSIHSFNRVFMEVFNMTPKEYRAIRFKKDNISDRDST